VIVRNLAFLAVIAMVMMGCGGGQLSDSDQAEQSTPESGQLPEGHPPVQGSGGGPMGMGGDPGPTDDHEIPLKLTGNNSVQELEAGLAETDNAEAQALFATGFRKTFSADRAKRDYAGAAEDLEKALALVPDYAHAYRALGYAKFNMGFDVDAAFQNYQKAVELNPEYGEAHYALAFMYVTRDINKGSEHFDKAMELGVPDERNLGPRYFNK
jgi:tetratricopeptide (TPR) repeat protein